jgi:hypothetical protein
MWTFEQSTGHLRDADGELVATGYAGGNCGKNPDGVNNPDMQYQSCIGPLPEGLYIFGQPIEQSHLGPFAIPLIPDESNQMFNRGHFYIHGDNAGGNNSASEGCIIMPRSVRNEMWASLDHALQVVRG